MMHATSRAAMTGYDSGPAGFWLGHDGSTPKFSIGNPSGNKLTWDGTNLTVVGDFKIGSAGAYSPTWGGFSTNPSGQIYYYSFNNFAVVYTPVNLTGASNAATFTMSLPFVSSVFSDALFVPCLTLNGTAGVVSSVMQITSGVGITGTFLLANSSGGGFGVPSYQSGGQSKGLPAGWCVTFPLNREAL